MRYVFLISFLIASLAVGSTYILSPNMSLPVPIVSIAPGPDWASDINSCMSSIDSHDHTPGYGVQIPPSGLNINASLPMGNNSLTGTKSISFQSQASLTTTQNIYSEGGDLWYNDSSGNIIRITQNGSVTGSSGTITGLPSGTASAAYLSGPGTFQFQSSTSTPANITAASVTIAKQTITPNGITFTAPNALAASYSLTFPTALPAASAFMMISSAGVLSTRTITAPTVQTFTSGSGTYTTPSGVLYIQLKMVGGGGGGGAASTNPGGDGNDSTFGSNTSAKGIGGTANVSSGPVGGTATLASGFVGTAVRGGGGGAGQNGSSTGGTGGASCRSGGGAGGGNGGGGENAPTNSGAGGGGGGGSGTGGGGGSAGGCIDAIKTSPAATYTYAVGAAGAGAAAGVKAGGAGGDGYIEVREFYQ